MNGKINKNRQLLICLSQHMFSGPGPPSDVEFPLKMRHERHFTAYITKPEHGSYKEFCAHLINSSKDNCTRGDSVSFANLEPGKKYEFSFNTRWNGVNSSTEKDLFRSVYTREYNIIQYKINTSHKLINFDNIISLHLLVR
jgi:hypothetical protein